MGSALLCLRRWILFAENGSGLEPIVKSGSASPWRTRSVAEPGPRTTRGFETPVTLA